MEAIHRSRAMIHRLLYAHKMFFHSKPSRASADADKWAACSERSVTPRLPLLSLILLLERSVPSNCGSHFRWSPTPRMCDRRVGPGLTDSGGNVRKIAQKCRRRSAQTSRRRGGKLTPWFSTDGTGTARDVMTIARNKQMVFSFFSSTSASVAHQVTSPVHFT